MRFSLLFLFTAATLLLPAAAMGDDVSRLRERILVLDQARTRAEAEFALREERGRNGEAEKASFETIKKSLDRRIEAACGQLLARGGSPAGLPCNGAGAGRADRKQALEKPGQQTGERETAGSEKSPGPEKKSREIADRAGKESAAAPPATAAREVNTAPAAGQGAEKNVPPPQPPVKPKTGLLEKIKLWWESLFKPKPPPSAAGSTAETRQQTDQKQASGATGQQSREQDVAERSITEQKAGPDQGSDGSTAQGELQDKSRGSDGQGKKGRGVLSRSGEKKAGQGEEPATSGDARGTKQEKSGLGTKEEQGSGAGLKKEETAAARAAAREKPNPGSSGTGKDQGKKSSPQHGSGSGAGSAQKQVPAQTGAGGSAAERGVATATGKKQNKAASSGRGSASYATAKPVPQGAGGASLQGQNKEPAAATAPAGTDKSGGRDGKPEVGELDRALNEALGEFDGKLLSEQERLAARLPRQRESSGTGAYGGPGAGGVEGSPGTGRQGYGAAQGGPGEGYAGTGDSGSPGGGSVAVGGKAAPARGRTTIDSDDDIVARQLREAAEKETDPELKEKLWQEYRKYKKGQ